MLFVTYTQNIDPAVKFIAINNTSTGYNLYIDNFELIAPDKIISEIDIDNEVVPINVCQGTPLTEVQNQLSSQIKIQDTDGDTYMVNVDWVVSGYNANIPAMYYLQGTFTLPDGVNQTMPETPLIVSTTVTVNALPVVACPPTMNVTVSEIIPLS